MRAYKIIGLALFVFLLPFAGKTSETSFEQRLKNLPGVASVEKVPSHSFFDETYEIMLNQHLDHSNPRAGSFKQRVVLSLYNRFSPVVFVAEGYSADYAVSGRNLNELSRIVEANQIVVEHRYFGKSVPENADWEYLTIENAVADLHRIYNIFRSIFPRDNKWIASGISKGGQNTIAYKAFYPNDMHGWVAYAGPVCFAVEDKRLERFLRQVGTNECRKKIENFQLAVLQNREDIQLLFDSLTNARSYTFAISNNEVLDFCVLEYSFSFWQWGHSCTSIPENGAEPRELFDHLVEVSKPGYFAKEQIEPIKPFFVQALNQFGYYGYHTRPFRNYLEINNAKAYIPTVFLNGEPDFRFSSKTSKFINKEIQRDGKNLILIYGEFDPWTAAGIKPKKRSNAQLFVMPAGSHRTQIDSMSFEQQGEIYRLLEGFLGLN